MSELGNDIYWIETAPATEMPPLRGDTEADVVVVGGGFTGLWTAYELLLADPELDVVVLEAGDLAHGASGRNAGFAMTLLDMSLSHLLKNQGREAARAAHLAVAESVDAIGAVCAEHGIDCDYHKGGLLVVATNPAQERRVEHDLEAAHTMGLDGFRALSGAEAQELVRSPTYLSGYLEDACATVHPARLAHGLGRVVASLGARLHEHGAVVDLSDAASAGPVTVRTREGSVTAEQVVVATNAWAALLAPFRHKVVPLYTYVILTEPLADAEREAVGWQGRQGVEDKRNYVHYYRITADGRILWGGRDGVIYHDLGIAPRYDKNDAVFGQLEQTFRATFPQLDAVRFSHRWGGPVGITVPFVPYFGSLAGRRVHYGFGYNGHGVAPSHTGGRILCDLVLGRKRGYEELSFVSGKESAFPSLDLLTWAGAELSRRLLQRQDAQMDQRKSSGDMDPMLLRLLRKLG
jgi:glycine/D-amino acid oxidase-like deaminating enzyme